MSGIREIIQENWFPLVFFDVFGWFFQCQAKNGLRAEAIRAARNAHSKQVLAIISPSQFPDQETDWTEPVAEVRSDFAKKFTNLR